MNKEQLNLTASSSILSKHNSGKCGCTLSKNPNYCVYQSFLDGWNFTPDVGFGDSRGEIFTPRFVVDKMIVDAKILPRKAVYNYDYKGSQETLRKYIGARVFEPAVGTGNFTSTILWHKLEMAHELTGYTPNAEGKPVKSESQLRRYQAYTLVALGSIYFNDIDAGNLQATKWRLLRDREISSNINIAFWVKYLQESLAKPVKVSVIKKLVSASIEEASENWGTKDRDRGVLDDLYYKHTGLEAPDWLRSAWKLVLDTNGKLFNAIQSGDTIKDDFICPGNNKVMWTFWRFENSKGLVTALRNAVPLSRQLLEGELRNLSNKIKLVPMTADNNTGALDLFTGKPTQTPKDKKAEQELRDINKSIEKIKKALDTTPEYSALDPIELFMAEEI